jgi:hypothetical protein
MTCGVMYVSYAIIPGSFLTNWVCFARGLVPAYCVRQIGDGQSAMHSGWVCLAQACGAAPPGPGEGPPCRTRPPVALRCIDRGGQLLRAGALRPGMSGHTNTC